jgi:hypothetical protein
MPQLDEDSALKEAMQGMTREEVITPATPIPAKDKKPQKGKGKPATVSCHLPAPSTGYTPPTQSQPIIYNTIEECKDIENIEPIDIKGELTEKERKFIFLHLTANVPAQTALIAAGYREYSENHAYAVARKIIKKYESRAETTEIFSDLNFGPHEIARGIVHLAIHCPNSQVRLNALALCAKAVGMLRDQIESTPGVTIIIKGRDSESVQVGGREPAAAYTAKHTAEVKSDKPVALVR